MRQTSHQLLQFLQGLMQGSFRLLFSGRFSSNHAQRMY